MPTSQDQMRVFRGLLWSPAWFFAYEGPYTKLAKIALVNLADSKTLNATLFGVTDCTWDATFVHGRSLVDTLWMSQHPSPKSKISLTSVVQESSWLQAYGRGSMRLASDKHFRYCPACLDLGFQSSLMQMAGLDECPVHSSALTNRCRHCNALCPRYAVCSEAFRHPMRCSSCGRTYSEAWMPSGLVECWKGIENWMGFARAAKWLARAGNLAAPALQSEALRELEGDQRRRVVFDFLRQEVALDLPVHRPATVVRADGMMANLPPNGRSELVARRISIFKSIRRHVERALKIKKLWRAERRLNDLFQNFLGPLFSIEGKTHPDLHGFLLWRARFEGATDFPSRRRRRRSYRGQVLQLIFWPEDPKAITSTMAGPAIDCSTWGIFVLYCLRNDLQSANTWASAMAKARDLSRGGEYSFELRKRELLSRMGWQLQPDSRDPPAGIGLIASDGRAMLYRVLAQFDGISGRVRYARDVDGQASNTGSS